MFNSMSNLQRKSLQELRFEATNVLVVSVIIGKTAPRKFTSKHSTSQSAVITFTVRDSEQFFTNCHCWGSDIKIDEYYARYRIGDIIDIISPQISPISQSSRLFHPKTSTPYALTVNEGSSSIEPHMFDTAVTTALQTLFRIPIKPISQALNLADIQSSGSHTNGQCVDLFVAIRHCKPVRTIKVRATGEDRKCMEIIVIDRSYPAGMSFSLWHEEWIERAENFWKTNSTVLYLMDAQLDYSTFYKRPVLSFSNKTIILENPNVKEAERLLAFVATIPSNSFDWAVQGIPDPHLITTLMTVQQIYDRAEGPLADSNDQFTAMIYAIVTKFDLDGSSQVVSKKCLFCKRMIPRSRNMCDDGQCQLNVSMESSGSDNYELYFDINIHLTDHTGTLVECRLMNNFAEKLLNCTTEQFGAMLLESRTQLKWCFLLERVTAKLVIKKKSLTRSNMLIMIVDMKPNGLDEAAEHILAY